MGWVLSQHRAYEHQPNVFADRTAVALNLADATNPQGWPGLCCSELLGRGRSARLRRLERDTTGPTDRRTRFPDDNQTQSRAWCDVYASLEGGDEAIRNIRSVAFYLREARACESSLP